MARTRSCESAIFFLSPSTTAGVYRISVASFKTSARADEVLRQLQDARVVPSVRVDAAGGWYRVIAEPYGSVDAAREAPSAQRHPSLRPLPKRPLGAREDREGGLSRELRKVFRR